MPSKMPWHKPGQLGMIRQYQTKKKHEFLHTLFPDNNETEEKDNCCLYINGFVLQRLWNFQTERWEVRIWYEEDFETKCLDKNYRVIYYQSTKDNSHLRGTFTGLRETKPAI
jgi:hypothetical protein